MGFFFCICSNLNSHTDQCMRDDAGCTHTGISLKRKQSKTPNRDNGTNF
uniref:Uncharacterized protein n=1 Tax=Aegilops tauschii subsp. strangulata TaxID=200361 RepID=A0A453EH02_AEGTS